METFFSPYCSFETNLHLIIEYKKRKAGKKCHNIVSKEIIISLSLNGSKIVTSDFDIICYLC